MLFILVWRYISKSLSRASTEGMLPGGSNLAQTLGLQTQRYMVSTLAELKVWGQKQQTEKWMWGEKCCGSPGEGLLLHTGVSGMLLGEAGEAQGVASLRGERRQGFCRELPGSGPAWSTGCESRTGHVEDRPLHLGRRSFVFLPKVLIQQVWDGAQESEIF